MTDDFSDDPFARSLSEQLDRVASRAPEPTLTLDRTARAHEAAARRTSARRHRAATAAAVVVVVVGVVATVAITSNSARSDDIVAVHAEATGGSARDCTGTAPTACGPPTTEGAIIASPRSDVDADLTVYVDPGNTQAELLSVARQIEQTPGVTILAFVDRAATYAEFQRLFADDEAMLAGIQPEDLPTSLRLRVDDTFDAQAVADLATAYRKLPFVYAVTIGMRFAPNATIGGPSTTRS